MTTLFAENVLLTEEDYRRISRIVYEHCGINLHDGKKELIRSRLAKKMRAGGFRNFSEYMEYVNKDETGREFAAFIDVLSTNLTSFFREKQHFEFLQNTLLPRLLEQKQKENNLRIRAWSAGCSSGEEPYSIAITLLENIAAGRWDIKILGTDISTRVLETARAGIYAAQKVEPVPQALRIKYLVSQNTNGQKAFAVRDTLRRIIVFRYLNLMNQWPITGPLDFIFCRNVMIYFDKPTQAGLVRRFFELLRPGGVLFTGHSESLTGIEHNFKYIQPTIYMKP